MEAWANYGELAPEQVEFRQACAEMLTRRIDATMKGSIGQALCTTVLAQPRHFTHGSHAMTHGGTWDARLGPSQA